MFRLMIVIIALVVLLMGIVALFSPIPIGAALIAISASVLVCISPRARDILRHLRHRHPRINHSFHKLEYRLENRWSFLSDAFMETRPHPPGSDREI